MEVTVFLENEFIPQWNKNQESDEPIVVEHKEPTMKLQQQLLSKPRIKMTIGKDGSMEGGEADASVDTEKIVKGMVTGIRNFPVKKKYADGTEKIVLLKEADDLFSDKAPSIISGFVTELSNYFQKLLQKEVDSKNSE